MHGAAGSDQHLLNMIYLTFTSFSMGFGLLTISTATFSLMFGTQKALMGGEGALESMDIAITALREKSR